MTNLKLVLSEGEVYPGSLRIEDGHIAEVVEGKRQGLDCGGLTALPGLVDLHGDMLERELSPRPGVEFPEEIAILELDKRLASNGVTTAFAAISFAEALGLRSEERAVRLIRAIGSLRPSLLTEILVHARYEITNPETGESLLRLIRDGLINLVSLMDHSPGQGQFHNLESLARYYVRWLGVEVQEALLLAQKKTLMAHDPATWQMARRIATVVRERGLPLASHDDPTRERVRFMADLGVTLSEFPVSLEAAMEAKRLGLGVVMGAPNALRGGSHAGNLSARVALTEGALDGLASDYHPSTLLQSAYRLVQEGILSLHQAVRLVAENPARLAGLVDRGRLAPGLRADLVLVEEGRYPRVRGTLRQGRWIYWDGRYCLGGRQN